LVSVRLGVSWFRNVISGGTQLEEVKPAVVTSRKGRVLKASEFGQSVVDLPMNSGDFP